MRGNKINARKLTLKHFFLFILTISLLWIFVAAVFSSSNVRNDVNNAAKRPSNKLKKLELEAKELLKSIHILNSRGQFSKVDAKRSRFLNKKLEKVQIAINEALRRHDVKEITPEIVALLNDFKTEPVVKSDLKLLIFVITAPANIENRNVIRSTWGSRKMQEKYEFQIIYMIGKTKVGNKNRRKLSALEAEMKWYGDIALASFEDHYRNLTLKSLSMLFYVNRHVRDLEEETLILKLDDDVVLDAQRLFEPTAGDVDVFNATTFPDGFACRINHDSLVERKRTAKWYVSRAEWSERVFPDYCDGPAYFFHQHVVNDILAVLEFYRRSFWLEDVYLTGNFCTFTSDMGKGQVWVKIFWGHFLPYNKF